MIRYFHPGIFQHGSVNSRFSDQLLQRRNGGDHGAGHGGIRRQSQGRYDAVPGIVAFPGCNDDPAAIRIAVKLLPDQPCGFHSGTEHQFRAGNAGNFFQMPHGCDTDNFHAGYRP